MSLDYCQNADIREGTLNRVGGNQTNYYGSVTIYCGPSSKSAPGHHDFCLTTVSELPPERILLKIADSTDALSVMNATITLIDQISNSLIDTSDSSNNHRDLERLLDTLRQILRLAKRAIKAYADRPLGQSLTNAIISEVKRCRILLSALLGKIHGTWVGLICTRIGGMWRQVFRSQWSGYEFAYLKRKLEESWKSLGTILLALNSYVSLSIVHFCLLTYESFQRKYKVLSGWSSGTN